MSGDDDIERLLREVDALNAGGSSGRSPSPAQPSQAQPARRSGGTPAKAESGRSARMSFAIAAAVVGAVLTGFLGLFLPFVGSFQLAIGGALGAFLTALIGGPPRWFGEG